MREVYSWAVALVVLAVGAPACSKDQDAKTSAEPAKAGVAQQAVRETAARTEQPSSATLGKAAIGSPAPAFALKDLDGNVVKLEQFAGKTVVLEWFNPGCPFVQRSHRKGSLVGTADKHEKAGVVWLAINSGAPGKQGHGVDANAAAAKGFGLHHPVLLDEDGSVGKAYGAERTPHMFVIDSKGVLVYRGAIDNSPDAEGQSPAGGTLVNYVDQALSELAQGKPVSVPETEAYGCSVKYGS
jgi:peroxiredoxin